MLYKLVFFLVVKAVSASVNYEGYVCTCLYVSNVSTSNYEQTNTGKRGTILQYNLVQ